MNKVSQLHSDACDKRVLQRILVTDNSGDLGTVSVIEYTERLNNGLQRTLIGYSLHTGQPGLFISADTFQLAHSGKQLRTVKVRRGRERTAKTTR